MRSTFRRELRDHFLAWFPLAAFVVSAALIAWGLVIYHDNDGTTPANVWDGIYTGLTFFRFNIGDLDPTELPWQLEIARFLAPVVTGFVAVEAFRVFAGENFHQWRVRRKRGHYLVTGRDELCASVALNCAARGHSVAVVNPNGSSQAESLSHHGVRLFSLDPRDGKVLKSLGASRAAAVMALDEAPEWNFAVASSAIDVAGATGTIETRVIARLDMEDEGGRLGSNAYTDGHPGVSWHVANFDDLVAKAIIGRTSDDGSERDPFAVPSRVRDLRILVASDDSFVENLIFQLARSLLLREDGLASSRVELFWVSSEAERRISVLQTKQPELFDVLKVRSVPGPSEDISHLDIWEQVWKAGHDYYAIVGHPDPLIALRTAEGVRSRLSRSEDPVVVASNGDNYWKKAASNSGLQPVNLLEHLADPATLMEDSRDITLAKELHHSVSRNPKPLGRDAGRTASTERWLYSQKKSWSELSGPDQERWLEIARQLEGWLDKRGVRFDEAGDRRLPLPLDAENLRASVKDALRQDREGLSKTCEPLDHVGDLMALVPDALLAAGLLLKPDGWRRALDRLKEPDSEESIVGGLVDALRDLREDVSESSDPAPLERFDIAVADLKAVNCACLPSLTTLREASLELLSAFSAHLRQTLGEEPDSRSRSRNLYLVGGAASLSTSEVEVAEGILRRATLPLFGENRAPQVDRSPEMVLSGGTKEGIPGLAGQIWPAARHLVCTSDDALLSDELPRSNTDVIRSGVKGHSFEEPILLWSKILQDHLAPPDIATVVFPGGPITTVEAAIALSLGGPVALIDMPNRYHLRQPEPNLNQLRIPADPMTLRVFLELVWPPEGDPLDLGRATADLAAAIHKNYRSSASAERLLTDPALRDWDELPEHLRASNVAQAHHIPSKLLELGLKMERVDDATRQRSGGEHVVISEEEILLLAELEHGRWNIERLKGGWKLGPRDPNLKLSPSLIPWEQLDEATKDYDIRAVEQLPALLDAAGWSVATL